MGTLTRAQLEAEVKFRLGNRSGVDANITTAVQQAYDELVTSVRVPENQETAVMTTADTVATVAVPTDLYAPLALRNATDGERLQPLSVRNYDRIRDTTTTAKPTHYLWWRNEITFWPTPDATARTILMRYMKRLPTLSATSTTTALAREWDEVVAQGAFFRMLRWLGLKEEAAVEQQEYLSMVGRRLDRLAEGQFDREDTAQPVLIERTAELKGWSG